MELTVAVRPVNLFLVGLSEGVARSVARYVKADPRVVLAGVAPSLALAGMLLPVTRSDIALLDWSTLDGSLPGALQSLRADRPGLRLVLVASETEPYRAVAVQAGADGVISQGGFARELDALLPSFFPERFRISGARYE